MFFRSNLVPVMVRYQLGVILEYIFFVYQEYISPISWYQSLNLPWSDG